jgi:O-antigen/teichoic acid export membrane protein
MTTGLFKATATLLTGNVAAHALPLLLGPALTRIYSPEAFGQFALLWAVATNVAVVACARYEYALPLERTEPGAAQLMALCGHVMAAVCLAALCAAGVLAWRSGMATYWLLPLAVLALGTTQWLTMWATRAERFGLLSSARLLQYGGGAVLQLALGWWAWGQTGQTGHTGQIGSTGLWGLCAGAICAALLAAWVLARPAPLGGWAACLHTPWSTLRATAVRHRDFPLLNTPHAFVGALQDTLTLLAVTAWSGDAAAGLWAMSLRYLKAPASLLGGALSQALYPRLVQATTPQAARQAVHHSMQLLAAIALPIAAVLLLWGPALFTAFFGAHWAGAGELARALAPYIALHFIASPLAVTTLAWKAQAWALRLALLGQVAFFAGLLAGLALGGLTGAAWGISASMLLYFGYYFWALATWKHIPDGGRDESLA